MMISREARMRYLLVVLMLSLMAVGQGQDGASLATKADKNDSRFTDPRTPLAHTHTKAQITDLGAVGGGLESGLIVFSLAACPSGYTELANAGAYVLLTTNAAGGAGTTGGSTSYTPAGTVTQPTFTGTTSQATSSNTVGNVTGTKLTTNSSGTAAATSVGGVTVSTSAQAFGSHSHTITPSGTVSVPSFNGTAATIQPPYIKLIACKKD